MKIKDAMKKVEVAGGKVIGGESHKIDSLLSVISIPRDVPLVYTGINEVGLHSAALVCIKFIKR
jgi:phosphoribosylcarboxyaminoimidazole (NCAIR) mutase